MTDDKGDERGAIIHLFGPPPAVEGAPAAAPRKDVCYPHSPSVDKVSRLVTCKRCKQQLDPVDVLLEVADRYDQWVRLGEETRAMRKEIEGLKAEEKRVKARTKAAARKDAAFAVEEERRRESIRRRATLDLAREIGELSERIGRLTMLKKAPPNARRGP